MCLGPKAKFCFTVACTPNAAELDTTLLSVVSLKILAPVPIAIDFITLSVTIVSLPMAILL